MWHSQYENFLSNWINSFALKIVRFKAEIQILLTFAKQDNSISNLLECLYNYEVNGLLQAPIFRKNWLSPLLGGHLPIKCEIRGPANSNDLLCESGQVISEQLRLAVPSHRNSACWLWMLGNSPALFVRRVLLCSITYLRTSGSRQPVWILTELSAAAL